MSAPTQVIAARELVDRASIERGLALVDGLLDALAGGTCEALTVSVRATSMELLLEEDHMFGRVLQGTRVEGLATIGRISALAGIKHAASWAGEGAIRIERADLPGLVISCRVVADTDGPRAELRARRVPTSEELGLPRVPGYQLLGRLGQGATAEVFAARHATLGHRVAIKVLFPEGAAAQGVELGELLLCGRARHPNLVDVHDAGTLADGRPYLVMELVTGPTLRARMDAGRLELAQVAAIVSDLARGLDVLHEAGLVHNDVKPDNVFVPYEGATKLADLGAARLTGSWSPGRVDAVFGTPLYIAPEYARGDAPDHRADIYSLGCVCHEMLAGSPPFVGETPRALLIAHLTATPPRLDRLVPALPRRLAAACARALAKNPDDRFATAGAFAAEVQSAIAGTTTTGWRLPWKR